VELSIEWDVAADDDDGFEATGCYEKFAYSKVTLNFFSKGVEA